MAARASSWCCNRRERGLTDLDLQDALSPGQVCTTVGKTRARAARLSGAGPRRASSQAAASSGREPNPVATRESSCELMTRSTRPYSRACSAVK